MTDTRMTGIRKAIAVAAIFVASLMVCVLAMAAQPAKAYAASVTQTGATASSITVSWTDPNAGNDYYTTTGYKVSWGNSSSEIKGTVNNQLNTSYTITGLNTGSEYYVKVEYTYVSKSTGSSYGPYTLGSTYDAATRVVKPTGVKQVKWWYYIKNVEFTWDVQKAATGVEWKLCKASTGKKVKGGSSTYPSSSFTANKISNNVVYTVQVRAKDKYGWSPWSDKAYLFTQPMLTKKTKATNGKLTLAWGKINGATGYQIFVSNKEKSGYKKVATLKSTKSSYSLKKFKGKKISKSKKYYAYIVATKKVGGKTYTSGKLYTAKIKGSSNTLKWTF